MKLTQNNIGIQRPVQFSPVESEFIDLELDAREQSLGQGNAEIAALNFN